MSNDIAIASLKEKIDELNHQAWQVRVSDSTKAFELSQQSVKLARTINYTKGLAEGLRSLGFGYIRLFKNNEAVPVLRESLSLFQFLDDLQGQAVVYEYLGIIERNWGNLGHSLELLLKGNELVQQVGSMEVEITSCYQIGVTYKHLGDHENALDYLYRSLSLAQQTNLVLMEAYATNIIGSIYFDNGNYEKALELYQQGLIIRRQSNDKWGEAGSLDNIGITYLKLNHLDKAIDYCMQSLEISQTIADKKGEANALLHLAEIYEKANDMMHAAKYSNESLEIRKARGDKRGEAEVLLFLAELHKNTKVINDQQLYEWISGALNIANEIKAQDLLSNALFNLHEYYHRKENYKESLVHLQAHLQIEKELHKNAIVQKVSNLEISHKAEMISKRNKELIELNEKIEKANEELKIEASLERVRTVTMSMSKPDDVLNICKVMFTELQTLGFKDLRNSLINFWDDDHRQLLDYDYSDFSGGNFSKLSYSSHPVFEAFQKKVRKATDAFAELVVTEDELETWKQRRRDSGEYEDPRLNGISALYYYFYSTGIGALGISTFSSISEDKLEVLKRFRNVFDLTYRRYLDIVKAEAQTREAKIEVAVERVRAKALAMHKSEDLHSVVVTLKKELMGLHIPDITAATIYLAQDDGSIRVLDLSDTGGDDDDKPQLKLDKVFRLEDTDPDIWIRRMWDRNENYFVLEADEDDFVRIVRWIRTVDPAGADMAEKIITEKSIKKAWLPTVKLERGVINIDLLAPPGPEIESILLKMGAGFDLAYKRFIDLQKAEAQAEQAKLDLIQIQTEKKRAEDALTELQTTQKQLIHAEKMASLGELTAGIAHEIQNPLNFVNNFSEVNKELIEELQQELKAGRIDDAIEISEDIKSNEEKINHHGKRADAIVKGMLQHSRASSGQKEWTDINMLADEYLRLAYHGLKAKDKSFNAKFETDLDPSIDKMYIVPQEIGRVILNLINNSFYAVSEKKKLLKDGYEPFVTVSTKTVKPPSGGLGVVEIKIKDNGNGIPQKVLDKIFQPFFTTKPTGQGTGLGLSLSYDIIKTHGGDIQVKTVDNEGSEFSITLPL